MRTGALLFPFQGLSSDLLSLVWLDPRGVADVAKQQQGHYGDHRSSSAGEGILAGAIGEQVTSAGAVVMRPSPGNSNTRRSQQGVTASPLSGQPWTTDTSNGVGSVIVAPEPLDDPCGGAGPSVVALMAPRLDLARLGELLGRAAGVHAVWAVQRQDARRK